MKDLKVLPKDKMLHVKPTGDVELPKSYVITKDMPQELDRDINVSNGLDACGANKEDDKDVNTCRDEKQNCR